jgi:hypothetical protein
MGRTARLSFWGLHTYLLSSTGSFVLLGVGEGASRPDSIDPWLVLRFGGAGADL